MKVNIKGNIIPSSRKWLYDWLEIPACCPLDIEAAISAAAEGEEMELHINSDGGSLTAGTEIYTMLRDYKKGEVTCHVDGLAASAASVIAVAGRRVIMSPVALMMIHNASCYAEGNRHDMETAAQTLSAADEAIAAAYIAKAGKSREEVLALMDKETWLTAARAVELGLADEIEDFGDGGNTAGMNAVALTNSAGMNDRVYAKIEEMILRSQGGKPIAGINNIAAETARRELDILKLKNKV